MKYYLTRNNDHDIFDNAFNSLFRPFFTEDNTSFMKTDVKETKTTYEMEIEMAGFAPSARISSRTFAGFSVLST